MSQPAGIAPTVRPSTAAQQSDGPTVPSRVIVVDPRLDLIVVVPPARSTAVTVVVEVKVSTPRICPPTRVQVKDTPLSPDGVVEGADDAGVPDGSAVWGPGGDVIWGWVENVGCGTNGVGEAAGGLVGAVDAVDDVPDGLIDAAAVGGSGPRLPNRENAAHPRSMSTIATMPTAPIIDIERMPTGPPAPGGRWRPIPDSIVIGSQDRRVWALDVSDTCRSATRPPRAAFAADERHVEVQAPGCALGKSALPITNPPTLPTEPSTHGAQSD